MGEAHGMKHWGNIETYSVLLEDQFFGLIGKSAHAYKTDSARLQLDYIPGTFDGRLTILNGKKKDERWGVQSWQTYKKLPGEKLIFKKDKDAQFWVPTYQYFIEFPMRIQKATAFAYAGEQMINGVSCLGIIASWNTIRPQKDIDQYLIWINQENKRIVKLEYTIREQFKFLTGAVYYNNYQNYNGLWLPGNMPVESNIKKGLLHEMRVLEFQPNQVSVEDLRPKPNLKVMGDDKGSD